MALVLRSLGRIGLLLLSIFGFIHSFETSQTSSLNGSAPVLNKFLKKYELPKHYNKYELPTIRGADGRFQKINIQVGLFIHNFRFLDEVKQEITVELDLKFIWTDLVIQDFDKRTGKQIQVENGVQYISLDSSYLDNIWWPDIIFNSLVSMTKPSMHDFKQSKPLQLRIYEGGAIQIYSRLIVKLSCPMNFQYYPADTQTCKFALKNHELSNDDIVFTWGFRNNADTNDKKVEVFLKGRQDANFYVFLHDVNQTVVQYNEFLRENEEEYTILEVSMSAKRKLTFHLMQTFLPSSFLVLITWLAFFMPINLLEARIGISMTTLLTLTSMFSSVKEYTPQVSYVKAIDIWMLACIISVFAALFEFCVLIWLRTETKKHSAGSVNSKRTFINRVVNGMNRDKVDLANEENNVQNSRDDPYERKKLMVYKRIMRTAERYGFFSLSLGFLGFNIVFWLWLLTASAYFNYEVDFNLNNKD